MFLFLPQLKHRLVCCLWNFQSWFIASTSVCFNLFVFLRRNSQLPTTWNHDTCTITIIKDRYRNRNCTLVGHFVTKAHRLTPSCLHVHLVTSKWQGSNVTVLKKKKNNKKLVCSINMTHPSWQPQGNRFSHSGTRSQKNTVAGNPECHCHVDEGPWYIDDTLTYST